MQQGINVDLDRAIYYLTRPQVVTWNGSKHAVEFRPDKKVAYKVRYRGCELTRYMPPCHTLHPTKTRFKHVTDSVNDVSEVHVCVPDLRTDERNVLSILHEIGHGRQMHELQQMFQGRIRPAKGLEKAVKHLSVCFRDRKYIPYDEIDCLMMTKMGEAYTRDSEQYAWKFALRAAQERRWQFEDALGFCNTCLETYDPSFKMDRRHVGRFL